MSKMKSLGLIVIFLVCMTFSVAKATSGQEKKINTLIQRLGQRDWQDAGDALAEIGAPAAKALIRTLKDRSIKTWSIHARAIDILAKIGTPESIKAIVETLKDSNTNQYVRGFAAMAIGRLKPKVAVEALSDTLSDKSQFVRWKSVQALGMTGDQQGANALIQALKDEDQYVRAAAVKSLQQIKASNAADALVDALDDESWLVRLNTRIALLDIGGPVFDSLIRALKDSYSRVRWQVAWILGRAQNEDAIDSLVDLLADPDWMVQDEVAVALARINTEKVANRLNEALQRRVGNIDEQAQWILARMKAGKEVVNHEYEGEDSIQIPPDKVYYGRKVYRCYPKVLRRKPDFPSPHITSDDAEVVTVIMKNGWYAIFPVTVENGKTLDYEKELWGKGRQLEVDSVDFPTLAWSGLHSMAELNQTKMITGRSIVEITEIGRSGRSSGAGFMGDDEDILSVLKGDNKLVEALDLKHLKLAKPLFHIWNMILIDKELGQLGRFWNQVDYVLYHGKEVVVKAESYKGWQQSIFDDEILGRFEIEISRELSRDEKAFLREKYAHLTDRQMAEFIQKLSTIHTGEMVPYYIMRYGFYEGHTDYRADPIAIAWIFGLRSIQQIEAAFNGKLYETLTGHFARTVGRN